MQTDYHSGSKAGEHFQAETAQQDSLMATLAKVRRHRRIRHTTMAAVPVAVCILTVKLLIPSPALPDDGPPRPVTAVLPLRVSTEPLAVGQKIVSISSPRLYVRSQTADLASMHIITPPDVRVPRIGEKEFRTLLATHDLYLIQVDGGTAEVRPLKAE